MKRKANAVTITTDPTQPSPDWPELRHQRRVIVVVDVVESVRLMQANEADVIDRWRRFVNEVRTQVLPVHGGRLVKSLGDGLLLEFETVPAAVRFAHATHSLVGRGNLGYADDSKMNLRIGAHVADVVVDELDIYGSGVNLAARITSLAGPGETVVSSEVRDQLVLGLDAGIEDLGESYLKHLSEPVRVFRVHPPESFAFSVRQPALAMPLEPTLAVIPFEGRLVEPANEVVGELIADSVIARLSLSKSVRVISRMSTSMLRARMRSASDAGLLLGATFVVSGSYRVVADRVVLVVELAATKSQHVLWADSFTSSFHDVLQSECTLVDAVCTGVIEAIAACEVRRSQLSPLPTLEGFSLQLAGVALIHRSTRRDSDRGREVLEHLVDRYPRAPEPRAWLAKWYVLRVSMGFVENLKEEAGRALEHTRRALDASPECSLALAMEAFVYCHMLRDLDGADARLDQALELNPNESVAWLYKCVTQGFRGEGASAVVSAERALALSPLDPLRHYYDALAASASLSVGNLARAIELASRSLRSNRNHLPTLRALAIAQVESGAGDEALHTGARILELDPGLTASDYVARGPKGAESTRMRYAAALREAGIPA